MPSDNKIIQFTAADIEKYYKGLLSATERHELEKAALDDPFLADALEGYANSFNTIPADLAELKERLKEKTDDKKIIPLKPKHNFAFTVWRVAALLILIAGAGFLVYQFAFNKYPKEIAVNKPVFQQKKDSPNPTHDNSANKLQVTEPKNYNATENKPPVVNQSVSSGMSGKKSDTIELLVNKDKSGSQPTFNTAEANQQLNSANTYDEAKLPKTKDAQTAGAPAKSEEVKIAKALSEKDVPVSVNRDITSQNAASEKRNVLSKSRQKNSSPASYTYRGVITDDKNNPVPFANVIANQNDNLHYSNAKGYFSLTSPDSVLIVQIHSSGYSDIQLQLQPGSRENSIILSEDKKQDEAVIQKKKDYDDLFATMNSLPSHPRPVDGWAMYTTYLINNSNIHENRVKNKTTGEVEVSFEVNRNGEPVNLKVEESSCSQCDAEAIRLIKGGPKWEYKSKENKVLLRILF